MMAKKKTKRDKIADGLVIALPGPARACGYIEPCFPVRRESKVHPSRQKNKRPVRIRNSMSEGPIVNGDLLILFPALKFSCLNFSSLIRRWLLLISVAWDPSSLQK